METVDEFKQVQSVTKRRVFYIPGYDPIHPRRYRELFRKEGADQAKISGYNFDLEAKKEGGAYGWHASTDIDGQHTDAQVDVLIWSDIVRASMSNSIPATYMQLLRTAYAYITTGALFRLMRLRKGPIIAALYPIGMLLVQLFLAVVAGAILSGLVLWGLTAMFGGLLNLTAQVPLLEALGNRLSLEFWSAFFLLIFGIGLILRAVIWIGVAVYILRWFKKNDGKFFAYYLMHDFAYSARWMGANPPALEDRMAEFGDVIAAALHDDVDEVLVVGHSSGAHLAVSILADLIRAGRVPETGPKLAFLSLGQVVPMVSFLPKADRLRRDLHDLSASDALIWVDVTAPGDGCAFALCDPVSVSGVEPAGKKWPLVFSAAFTQTLSPERWRELRWRFFRLHFQYLCAFDRPNDYDYFQITAGPVTLYDRYHDRKQSWTRIDVAASGYTSMS
ncbi:hypothetical protein [Litoreibacter albidus]|uniref:Alpha/beta hydrolase family protein n=1 Tax=Litoreibacter albidus TaxID=670155 RepID=A0A1H2SSH1_9RHOB|nr:hypothetical protein [Litoreibacter albidus]SDW34586.1 hypothetical protein SAMN04488001_0922 [Litoreibacter albidus]